MKTFWATVAILLAAGALLLAWHGVKNVVHGLEGADAGTPNGEVLSVFLLLGLLELFGAVVSLFLLHGFARARRLIPGRYEHADARAAIRARASAHLNAARGQGN